MNGDQQRRGAFASLHQTIGFLSWGRRESERSLVEETDDLIDP
jgi:hypothetical protein